MYKTVKYNLKVINQSIGTVDHLRKTVGKNTK